MNNRPDPVDATLKNALQQGTPMVMSRAVRDGMEAFFGATFREVRILESESVAEMGACAMTFGNDIIFAPGEYRTTDPGGLQLLGHELAHVLQQRAGRLRIGPSEIAQLHFDECLEAEAEQLGRLAAVTVAAAGHANVRRRASSPPGCEQVRQPAVQCMMSVEKFKDATKARGSRNKIVAVDTLLQSYVQAIDTKPRDLVKALRELKALRAGCDTYFRERPKSDREAGVRKLLVQADIEEYVLDLLVKAEAAAGGSDKMRLLMDARDSLVERLRTQPVEVRSSLEWLNSATNDISNRIVGLLKDGEGAWKADAQELVTEDIKRLQHIAAMSATPGLIRAMLNQILASRNLNLITPGLNTPGAKFNETRGAETKYTLNHRLVYDGGVRYRIGALVHELTHVCVSEVYGNTVLMFAIPRDATDEQWLMLSRARRSKLGALQELISSDKEINDGVFALEALAANLNTQCRYALGSKVKTNYLTLFKAKLEQQEGVDFVPRMERLCDQGLGSELIEYDSVINQMLIWCYMQGVGPENAVYKSLSSLAAEEMLHRARAIPKPRLQAQPVVKPSNVVKPVTPAGIVSKPAATGGRKV